MTDASFPVDLADLKTAMLGAIDDVVMAKVQHDIERVEEAAFDMLTCGGGVIVHSPPPWVHAEEAPHLVIERTLPGTEYDAQITYQMHDEQTWADVPADWKAER